MPIKRGQNGLQRIAAARNGWTLKRRRLFLDELASSCNVSRAAAAAGMERTSAHRLRRSDPVFADLWVKAIEIGADRLDRAILAHSLAQLPSEDNPGEERAEAAETTFDVELALKVLKERAATAKRERRYRPCEITPEEVDAELEERFQALAKRLARRGGRGAMTAARRDKRRARVLRLTAMSFEDRWWTLAGMSDARRKELLLDWHGWAQRGQAPPPGEWRVWVLRSGRGFGKTRSGAEWVTMLARNRDDLHVALVAATSSEARRVMVEGESGLLAVANRTGNSQWHPTTGTFRFASGSTATVYSADAPDTLRGPQHHYAWCDELAKWRYGDAAWDNLMMGLRLGEAPRVVVTTTPRATPLVRRVLALPDCVQTRGSTRDNVYLPASVVASLEAEYAGTRLGRQELDGELLEDHEGALWTRAMLDACRCDDVPTLVRVVVAVDPPASAGGDACGIIAAGVDADGVAWVLEDASVGGASPGSWAAAVAACAARHGADRVVAEANQGGDMVRHVLLGADAALPVKLVHASRGKLARAEPVAALYERGKVRHVRGLGALEDELVGLVTGGVYAGPGRSPDRADALVWALTALCLTGRRGKAGVRRL